MQSAKKRSPGIALRDWHSNISAFIAPVIVFYAISGALQIFDLHESHDGYVAPAIVSAMGRLHKNQILKAPPHRAKAMNGAPGPGGPDASGRPKSKPAPSLATLALKWLFFLEALGLATTTVLGAWIGLTHAKRKRTIVTLLVAGTLIPIVLIVI